MGSVRLLACAPALAALGLTAAPAAAALPNSTVGALAALTVPNVAIISVADVPASAPNPEFCDVLGTLRTTGFGAPDGSAGFEIRLPATWNGKFLFLGVGGFAGSLSPSVNPLDFIESLGRGYATAVTDTGHSAGATDAPAPAAQKAETQRSGTSRSLYKSRSQTPVLETVVPCRSYTSNYHLAWASRHRDCNCVNLKRPRF